LWQCNAQVSPGTPVPLDYRYLVENFVGLVPSATTAGGRHATEADGVYLVESARRYVLVVFADKPTDVARFCVLVASQPHCAVHFRYVGRVLSLSDRAKGVKTKCTLFLSSFDAAVALTWTLTLSLTGN